MRTPPRDRRTPVPTLLLATLLLFLFPLPAAAAPLPPAADVSWDGRLTLSITCPQSPDDARLIDSAGNELLPQQPAAADTAGNWLISFQLPQVSGRFQLHGCSGQPPHDVIIARPLPLLPAAALFGGLCVLGGLLCGGRRQPQQQRTTTAATWNLAVWDGRQEWLVPLRGPSATLGHHDDCEIVVNGPAVAARHARLVLEADGIRLIDLGHAATFVGPIRRRLRPGESLTLQSDEEIVLGTAIRIRLQRAVNAPSDRS
jgi:hypothetical protein